MKRYVLLSLLMTILSVASQTDVAQGMMTVQFADSYGTTGGGEFRITPLSGWSSMPKNLGEFDGFEAFCVEKNEYISLGHTYYVKISTAATRGGVGGQETPGIDPLDERTAYLYRQFITKSLDGYSYASDSTRVDSADALQHVIWYLEDEESMEWTINDGSLMDKFYQDAEAHADGIGNVRIMSVFGDSNYTKYGQDQLIMIPAPSALVLGSLGVGLVGFLRRRRWNF